MKDEFLPTGLVTKQDSTKDGVSGLFSISKMFWKYLLKNNVAFYNSCCTIANTNSTLPVSYTLTGPQLQYFNGTVQVAIPIATPTTTPVYTTVTTGTLQSPSGSPLIIAGPAVIKYTPTAVNTTATLTTTQVESGYITSTSAATVTMTLPTATALATALGVTGPAATFDFFIDNINGANIVTVALGSGDTAITPVVTGEATLTVAAATVGQFRLIFTSATAAKIARII